MELKAVLKFVFGFLHFVFLFGVVSYGIALFHNFKMEITDQNKGVLHKNLFLFSIGASGLISLYVFYFLII